MEEKKNIMDYDTVSLDDENSAVVIIDQTKLPGTTEIIALKTAQEIWDAIYLLRTETAYCIALPVHRCLILDYNPLFFICHADPLDVHSQIADLQFLERLM